MRALRPAPGNRKESKLVTALRPHAFRLLAVVIVVLSLALSTAPLTRAAITSSRVTSYAADTPNRGSPLTTGADGTL